MTISFNKINNTVGKDLNKFLLLTYLRTTIEQLQKNRELNYQIDLQIKKLMQMPEELEDSVCEMEELQDSITEKISKLQMHVELKTQKLTVKSFPNNIEDVASRYSLVAKEYYCIWIHKVQEQTL